MEEIIRYYCMQHFTFETQKGKKCFDHFVFLPNKWVAKDKMFLKDANDQKAH